MVADVQVENGFTRIANQILEEIAQRKFNGTEFRIIMILWRYTYGFNRKQHSLSTGFIAEAIGMDNSRVRKVLKDLIDNKVIDVTEQATFNHSRVLAFNKNFEEWGVKKDMRGRKVPLSPNKQQPEGSKRSQPQGSKSTPKKESIKDIYKDIKEEDESGDPIINLLIKNNVVHPNGINYTLHEDLNDIKDTFGFEDSEEMIKEAIKDAARGNGKTWKFVYNKLNLWRKQGIKNKQDLEYHSENTIPFKRKKAVGEVDWDKI